MHENKRRFFKKFTENIFIYYKLFRTLTYIDLEPHSIWDTLISHVRSVEVPEKVNAIVAVTPEAGPVWTYTRKKRNKNNILNTSNSLIGFLLLIVFGSLGLTMLTSICTTNGWGRPLAWTLKL